MEYNIDAKNQRLGRLASQIAHILQGKNSVAYQPRLEGDAKVIVSNVGKMEVSGKKADQKIYYRHTGYAGHLKKRTYREFFKQSPKEVLRAAVLRMLPKNRLQARRIQKLIIQ